MCLLNHRRKVDLSNAQEERKQKNLQKIENLNEMTEISYSKSNYSLQEEWHTNRTPERVRDFMLNYFQG